MKDLYSMERFNKYNQESKVESDLDEEAKKYAEDIERQNYMKAKNARMKTEKSLNKMKNVNSSLLKQDESIDHVKKLAVNTNKNVGKTDVLTDKIESESKFFNISLPFWKSVKGWWKRDPNEEKTINKIKTSEKEIHNEEEISDEVSSSEGEEYVKGQHKTDKELKKMLKGLKNINKEAETQKGLVTKQKKDLQNINELNEYTKKKANETEDKLKKSL